MRIDAPIAEGAFLKRLNRFLALVEVENEEVLAHVHDPGRLKDLLIPGARVYLRRGRGKYRYYLYAVEAEDGVILVDSALHSRIAEWLVKKGLIFQGYRVVRREVPLGKSRIDFLLQRGKTLALLEVKGCSLLKGTYAMFPDAPTVRGRRHLLELAKALEEGYEAYILFIVVRPGAKAFKPNWDVDPKFSQTFREILKRGVKALAYKVCIKNWTIEPLGLIPIIH